jgi:lipopolysaccharide export system protein LptC
MNTTLTPSGPVVHSGVRESQAAPRRQRARLSRFVAASVRRRRHNTFYSRFVTLMKVVLPATAVALASLVIFWPQLNPLDNRFRLKPVQVSIDDLENLRMVSPRFVGTDARNQPFAITADQATQEAGGSDVTALANPKGDLTLNNGSWVALAALEGQYHKATQILDLWDEVNVFHDAGYEIKTRRAKADLGKGDVFGDDAVEGQGPDSQLRGQGFRIYEKGARIAITGKSRLILYPTPPEKK